MLARFLGLIVIAVGAAIGAAVMYFTQWQIFSLTLGCGVAAAVDLYFRVTSPDPNRWLSPDGPNLRGAPVYLLAVAVFVLGLLLILRVI